MGPPGPATRLLPPLVLALAGVARGTFTVVAWPRVAVVAFGGSVTVNCSRSACPGDNATLGLDTALPATPGPGGLRWQSFRLHNVSRWSPGPVTCSGRCGDTEANASAGVLVYQLPERVELEPVPAVAVGDSRNLTCHVREVAPLRNLTVTLRRGATLRTESFGDAEGSASVAVSHVLTVTRGDHGQDVTCHAELSLRPHGPLFARAAVPVTLSVFALPDPPQLQAPAILEAGAVANASCRITGAFPAGDIRVTAALDQEPLNVTAAVAGDTVTASTALSPRSPGPRELSCTAAVATVARTARRQLHVYRFPAPALELSPAPAAAGSEVTVTCHAGNTEPPAARLQLRDADGGVLAEGPQPRLQLRLLARRHDDGREFRCRASLAVGDSVVTKDADARLAVLCECRASRGPARPSRHSPNTLFFSPDLPEIPASGCPGNRTWVRGAREALSCRATGNPAPTVVCGRDGVAVATGEPEPVTRSRAGTYVCNATNALGTRSRRVTVRVECEWHRVGVRGPLGGRRGDRVASVSPQDEPTMSESGCPARRVWVEGQRRELECRADGDPPPSTRCARDGGTRDGGTRDGGTRDGGTQHGGTQHGGTRDGGTRDGGTQHGGTQHGGTQHGGTRDGGTRDGGTQHGGTQHGGTQHGGTQHGGSQHGGVARGRVVTRADGGRYVCRATNRHGVAVRSVLVTVEYQPSLGERGCPERRRWLEGTPAELGCAATGNPPPRVTCAKLGDPANATELGDSQEPPGPRPMSPTRPRGHLPVPGHQRRGSAVPQRQRGRGVRPRRRHRRASCPPPTSHAAAASPWTAAPGVPAPTYTWRCPRPQPALGADNRFGHGHRGHHGQPGLYTRAASNRTRRRAGSVVVRVDESWLVLLAALGALGAVTALGLAVAGGFYLKSTACKKGEYNVRDAEGSSEAACLHRQREPRPEVFGIQLSPP
ncbi:intercellular adhesion molecule 5-like [Camarhynchus parvulus]|uniref:intercellular adhesion molecule 5-like n=1 Tax=Geospiza parvula TaxID=87175 RepID=UPI0012381C7B|nr:intercellular adhesion molecule 5-like [Camarhynchus parvulus]